MTLNIQKLSARLSEEKEMCEAFYAKLRSEGAEHADCWLMGFEVEGGASLPPAPFEIIKAVAHLPIRKYNYRGLPRDGDWTNEDWAELCNIDLDEVKERLFRKYEGAKISFEAVSEFSVMLNGVEIDVEGVTDAGEEVLVIKNLDELLERFGGYDLPLNNYVAGFVGRVRSAWNDIAGTI